MYVLLALPAEHDVLLGEHFASNREVSTLTAFWEKVYSET
jgi:hypothetical protein